MPRLVVLLGAVPGTTVPSGEWRAPSIVAHDVQALAEAAADTYDALARSRLSRRAQAREQWATPES